MHCCLVCWHGLSGQIWSSVQGYLHVYGATDGCGVKEVGPTTLSAACCSHVVLLQWLLAGLMMVSEQACCTASMAAGGANDGFRAGILYCFNGCWRGQ